MKDAILARARPRLAAGTATSDRALAAALAIPSLVQVLAVPIAPRAVGVAIALASTVPIAWRRSRPIAAALAGTAPWLIPSESFLVLGFVAAFILYFSLGREVESRRRLLAGLAGGVALCVLGNLVHDGVPADYFGALTVVLTATGVGRFVRRERERTERLHELTLHLERERERGALLAVAEERARIARELHDEVSHGLSVIAIQADAAGAVLDSDPARAREPLAAIRASAAEALAEMRRLLGVLREDGAPAERAPLPGVGEIPRLVEQARGTGAAVELAVEGEPRQLPASLGLSAYRIVQEALTNARRHAPGAAVRVRLAWSAEALAVEVVNAAAGAAPRPGSGHGLIGMRERVRLHGGELAAGPSPEGGFEVRARLPLAGRAPFPEPGRVPVEAAP